MDLRLDGDEEETMELEPIQSEAMNPIQLHQMIFIYNAVMAGWSVRKIATTGNFRFKKRVETQPQRQYYNSDSFLQRFLQNMQRLDSSTHSPSAVSSQPRIEIGMEQVSSFELPGDKDIILPK